MSIPEELARREERLVKLAEARAKLEARGGIEGPQPKDQINLTDEDSRIMPVAGGGFEQCYNAQAVVATTVAPSSWAFPGGEPETPQFSPRPGRLVRSPW